MSEKRPFLYPWVLIFSALSLGILLTKILSISFEHIAWALTLLFILSFIFIKKRIGLCFIFGLVVGLGMFLVHVHYDPSENDITFKARYYYKKQTTLRAEIISDVLRKEGRYGVKNVATIKLNRILSPWGWRNIEGKVLLQAFGHKDIAYGDSIEIVGKLHRPFHIQDGQHFSYRDYLKNKNIHYIFSVKKITPVQILEKNQGSVVLDLIYQLRHALHAQLNHFLTNREAGVMAAMMLGDRSGLPKDIRALFVRTGTAHILAISGLHIGILTGLFYVFLGFLPIGRKYQYLILVVILAAYAILSGLRASVLRATLMAMIFMGGFIWERKSFGLNSLMFAGCILLVYEPYLLFDVGFQLSFTCVFFIFLGASGLHQRLQKFMPAWLANTLSVSVCATLGSMGLVAYYFGMVTPISIFVNIAAVPLMSAVLVCGLGFLCTCFWCIPLAYCFSLCLKLALNLMVAVIFVFDLWPGSYIYLSDVKHWYVIVYYVLVIVILGAFFISRRIDKDSQLC